MPQAIRLPEFPGAEPSSVPKTAQLLRSGKKKII
jgi:hypothetical protein